jgi:hypothetical protein
LDVVVLVRRVKHCGSVVGVSLLSHTAIDSQIALDFGIDHNRYLNFMIFSHSLKFIINLDGMLLF